ncbi:MAG: cation-translocating P-type ATPase, partial [Phycisphaerales bacterium]|nr:cation-translocating P-type ATPase [Phycisphaerales bacterium]
MPVSGMHCGSCAVTVRRAIQRLDGVADVSVNYDTGVASIRSADGIEHDTLRPRIAEAIRAAGFTPDPPATDDRSPEDHAWRLRAVIGIALSLPLMILMFVDLPGRPWIELALATPVQFWVGW